MRSFTRGAAVAAILAFTSAQASAQTTVRLGARPIAIQPVTGQSLLPAPGLASPIISAPSLSASPGLIAPALAAAAISARPTNNPAASAGFRFDPESSKCLNKAGEQGLNSYDPAGLPGQCTDFRGHPLVYKSFSKMDLRGSMFGQNHTYGGALGFDECDLRFSTFEPLMIGHGYHLSGSDLRGADLSRVEISFVYEGSTQATQIVALDNAVFDAATKLPRSSGLQLTPEDAVSKLRMIRRD